MSIEQQSSANFLIRALGARSFAQLGPWLERVGLERGKPLVIAGEPTEYAYFPEGGVCSIVVLSKQDEPTTEVGLFGREGVSSLQCLLDPAATSLSTIVQIEGDCALRIDLERLRQAMEDERELRLLIMRFVHVMMCQMAMTAASYSHDLLESRLARWLLMCRDRLPTNELAITHEFLANMLGSRRSSVTVTLHVLEGMGAIRSSRGLVIIRDRQKLEDLAGETYGPPEREYGRLIGDFNGLAGIA